MTLLTFLSDLRILVSVLIGTLGFTFLLNATPRSRPYVVWLAGSALVFATVGGTVRVLEFRGWIPTDVVRPLGAFVALFAWSALIAGMHVYFAAANPRPFRWFVGSWLLAAAVVAISVLVLRPWPFAGPLGIAVVFTGTSVWLATMLWRQRWYGRLLLAAAFLAHPVFLILAIRADFSVEQFRQLTPVPITVAYIMVIGLILQRDGQRLARELRERKRAEAGLQELADTLDKQVQARTKQLEDLVGGLQSFAGMVSHDLRGPLGNVQSLAGMARTAIDSGDGARAERYLSLLERESERAHTMVADLLTLARSDQAEPNRRPVDMDALVAECVQALERQYPRARECVTYNALPRANVDPDLFRHALVNLIGNALKFGAEQPGLRVQVSAHREGEEWHFSIADNGPGFDGQRASELFRPFVRLDPQRVAGTGLGLTVVRRVVERHGGRVMAESELGRGARFSWTLPATGT